VLDEHVGEYVGAVAEGDRVVTHYFECTLSGYAGWRWAVTVARAPRAKNVTVCETVATAGRRGAAGPGLGALWTSGSSRATWASATSCRPRPTMIGLRQAMCSPTIRRSRKSAGSWVWAAAACCPVTAGPMPPSAGTTATGVRTPRFRSVRRPRPAAARAASTCRWPAPCGSCSAWCGNVFAPDDCRVVTADHGCGAHSEVLVEVAVPVEEAPTIYDDSEVEAVAVSRSAGSVTDDEPAESYGHG